MSDKPDDAAGGENGEGLSPEQSAALRKAFAIDEAPVEPVATESPAVPLETITALTRRFMLKLLVPDDPGEPLAESELARLAQDTTPALAAMWRATGFGTFGDGLVRLCDPLELQPAWLNWSGLSKAAALPIAQTAFGHFLVLQPDGRLVLSDVWYRDNRLFANHVLDFVGLMGADEFTELHLNRALHQQVREALGPISPGQLYGLEVPLPMGGKIELENFFVADAEIYLDIARQAHGRAEADEGRRNDVPPPRNPAVVVVAISSTVGDGADDDPMAKYFSPSLVREAEGRSVLVSPSSELLDEILQRAESSKERDLDPKVENELTTRAMGCVDDLVHELAALGFPIRGGQLQYSCGFINVPTEDLERAVRACGAEPTHAWKLWFGKGGS